jgi:4-hydroxy-tetrahydrodipicolinate synthase
MHDLCAAALRGDHDGAAAIDGRVAALHKALFVEPNPIPVKWAVHRMGLIGEALRLPLVPLTAGKRAEVETAMRAAGVLAG